MLGFERRSTLAQPGSDLFALFGATPTSSGVGVSAVTALQSPTCLAAIRAIAETIGGLPVQVFRRNPDGSRERDDSHPAAALLTGDWCPWSSSTESRTTLQTDALLHGAGYAQAVRVSGQVRELHRLEPTAVTPELNQDTGEPSYRVRQARGSDVVLPWSDVINLHVPGAAWNRPINLVSLAREAIGLDITMAAYQGRLFSGGARPSGVFEHPKMLSAETLERLAKSFRDRHAGGNSGGTLILEDGMKFTPLSFSSVDLQFLELRRFAVQEIGRVFKVPATFIGDLERATWRNVEELSRQFLTFCLLPWLEVWESAISRVVFTPQERTRFFVEFQTADLLRGDTAGRFAAYRNSAGGAWMTPNEVRRLENLPPVEGGDELIKQAGQSGAVPVPTDDPRQGVAP